MLEFYRESCQAVVEKQPGIRSSNQVLVAQQTTSSFLKKQNQEREFEGSETDPVQIDIYVWVCQS